MTALLSVEDLSVHFKVRHRFAKSSREVVHAADDVTFAVHHGQTFALVGESGSGKTTVARAVLQLVKPTAGQIVFQGHELESLKRGTRRRLLQDMQVVFQDPYSSLNPRMTVHDVVAEPLRAWGRMGGVELNERIVSLLDLVGLGTQHLWRRSHEFSGGQCQRIAIARALALNPKLLILDEPTSALDVSVQARILALLDQLQSQLKLAFLFIAHDLAVVEAVSDRIAVMYLGQIVETGPTGEVLGDPRHPYTRALLASVPSPDPDRRSEMGVVSGEMASAVRPPKGCRFHPRCDSCKKTCAEAKPVMTAVSDGHVVACHECGGEVFPPSAGVTGAEDAGVRREARPGD